MKNDLTTLGFKRLDDGDEYGFAVARTEGRWHIVRKQYGDNSAVYNYAQFTNLADAYSVWADDLDAPVWHTEPPSNVDFSILLLGMTAPLPSSTGGGAVATGAATSAAQARNYDQLVALNAAQPARNDDGTIKIDQPIQVFVTNATVAAGGQMQTSGGATEVTASAIKQQLAGTLTVHVDNPTPAPTSVAVSNFPDPVTSVAISNFPAPTTSINVGNLPAKYWPDSQPVTGAFWPAVQPVSFDSVPLAPNAATAALQMVANSTAADISSKLGGTLTVAFAGVQPVTGTVQVGNFPASQHVTVDNPTTTVSIANFPAPVTTVAVSNLPASQPVTFTAPQHVIVDNPTSAPTTQQVTGQVSVSNFPASQAVTLATNTPDVTDRPARVLGHVTVDNPVTTVTVANPVTSVAVSNQPATYPVTGTFWQPTQPVSGPLTDTQLRATPVPVSGFPTTYPVTGTFWQPTQPVSAAALPLPTGASTEVTLAQIKAKTDNLDVLLSTRTKPADTQKVDGSAVTQPISAAALPLPAGASTAALQATMQTSLDAIKANTATNAGAPTPVTPYSLVVATGNNAVSVKSSTTQLTGLLVTNATSSYKYLMAYNLATAPVTGSVPLITLGVPPNQSVSLPIPAGKYVAFSTGFALAVGSAASLGTLVAGLLGTTGVSANDMVINATYA